MNTKEGTRNAGQIIHGLEKRIAELQDFVLWMTGCGYEFTQHEFFNRQRDKLILDKPPKEQGE